jgi:hypothetical protein
MVRRSNSSRSSEHVSHFMIIARVMSILKVRGTIPPHQLTRRWAIQSFLLFACHFVMTSRQEARRISTSDEGVSNKDSIK